MDKKYNDFNKNINNFFRDKLSGNNLRRFCYTALNDSKCYNVLLEEYMFFVNLNDLDKEYNFNYKKNLDKKLNSEINKIHLNDKKLIKKYILISLSFLIVALIIFIILIRIVYR